VVLDGDAVGEGEPPSPGSGSGQKPRREIQLQNPNGYREVAARRLRPWIEAAVEALAPRATSLAVRFASDRALRRLNRDFRGRDKSTDVLSFPGELEGIPGEPVDGGESLPGGELHLGDIAIAVPTARRQAREHGHDEERELRVLLLHGLLHCLGYDHETDDGTMERIEHDWRERLIGPSPMD
jgi:probable rRNA maturation factor